jgi:hypothetical protein
VGLIRVAAASQECSGQTGDFPAAVLTDEQRGGVYRRLLGLALAESRARFRTIDAAPEDPVAEPAPSPWRDVYDLQHLEYVPPRRVLRVNA